MSKIIDREDFEQAFIDATLKAMDEVTEKHLYPFSLPKSGWLDEHLPVLLPAIRNQATITYTRLTGKPQV